MGKKLGWQEIVGAGAGESVRVVVFIDMEVVDVATSCSFGVMMVTQDMRFEQVISIGHRTLCDYMV